MGGLTVCNGDEPEYRPLKLIQMKLTNLELIDVRLKLLLDPQSLSLGPGLSLQGSMKGIHGTLVVLPEEYNQETICFFPRVFWLRVESQSGLYVRSRKYPCAYTS